ncbi:MAG: hypothetical protein KDK30_16110 [Leptospiraceae bacterium]|nr:hypothetical protein [Leptospiraceae bacterium]
MDFKDNKESKPAFKVDFLLIPVIIYAMLLRRKHSFRRSASASGIAFIVSCLAGLTAAFVMTVKSPVGFISVFELPEDIITNKAVYLQATAFHSPTGWEADAFEEILRSSAPLQTERLTFDSLKPEYSYADSITHDLEKSVAMPMESKTFQIIHIQWEQSEIDNIWTEQSITHRQSPSRIENQTPFPEARLSANTDHSPAISTGKIIAIHRQTRTTRFSTSGTQDALAFKCASILSAIQLLYFAVRNGYVRTPELRSATFGINPPSPFLVQRSFSANFYFIQAHQASSEAAYLSRQPARRIIISSATTLLPGEAIP